MLLSSERDPARLYPSTSPSPLFDDSKLRVLWLIKGLGPGGAERLLVSAAKLADRSRFDFEVAYLLPWKTALVGELEGLGIRVTCLGGARRYDPRWVLALRRLLRARPFQVVHTHSPVAAVGARLAVSSLARSSRPALMSTEHNSWSSHRPLTRWANRLTFGMDDAHLAVSEDTRRSLPNTVRPTVEVVVHGTSLAEASAARARRDEVRAALGVDPDEVVIITVANLRSNKAYPDLLAAARQVVDAAPGPCRFLAVGQGPLAEEVDRERLRLGLVGRFELLGRRDDVFDLLAASDVFVLASKVEGYPVALMEALAVGLPVVATAVGGIPDAIRSGENGILVPPGRPDRLAAALLDLVGDAEKRRRLAKAAMTSGLAFDAGTAVGRTEEVYNALAASKSVDRRSLKKSVGDRPLKKSPLGDSFMFQPCDPTRGAGSVIEGGGV